MIKYKKGRVVAIRRCSWSVTVFGWMDHLSTLSPKVCTVTHESQNQQQWASLLQTCTDKSAPPTSDYTITPLLIFSTQPVDVIFPWTWLHQYLLCSFYLHCFWALSVSTVGLTETAFGSSIRKLTLTLKLTVTLLFTGKIKDASNICLSFDRTLVKTRVSHSALRKVTEILLVVPCHVWCRIYKNKSHVILSATFAHIIHISTVNISVVGLIKDDFMILHELNRPLSYHFL